MDMDSHLEKSFSKDKNQVQPGEKSMLVSRGYSNLRWFVGVPRVNLVMTLFQAIGIRIQKQDEFIHPEIKMLRGETFEIIAGESQKSRCGFQSSTMHRMSRVFILELEMDKSTGGLDHAFIIELVGAFFVLKPEIFENIMGIVIKLVLEAFKIAEIAGVVMPLTIFD